MWLQIQRMIIETILVYIVFVFILYLEDGMVFIKTEYGKIIRGSAFIIPPMIRFFSIISWMEAIVIELVFIIQIIDIFSMNMSTTIYTSSRILIGFIIFFHGIIIVSIDNVSIHKKYICSNTKEIIEDNINLEVYDYTNGKIVEQIYYNRTKIEEVKGCIMIFPFLHNAKPNGNIYNIYTGKDYKIKGNIEDSYTEDYYENFMLYDRLADVLNGLGYDVIRFKFSKRNNDYSIDIFCTEVKQIIQLYEIKDIYLLGHGVQGCIEAEVMSEYISTKAMVLLCGAGTTILESIRQGYKNTFNNKYWIMPWNKKKFREYFESIEKLPVGKFCDDCTRQNLVNEMTHMCTGFCKENITLYFESLRKYSQDELENIISKYDGKILIIFAQMALDYNSSKKRKLCSLEFYDARIVEIEKVYDTFRSPHIRDYRLYNEIYKVKKGEKDIIDSELLMELKSFL